MMALLLQEGPHVLFGLGCCLGGAVLNHYLQANWRGVEDKASRLVMLAGLFSALLLLVAVLSLCMGMRIHLG